ncbi:trypsin-like serine peptidase [Aquisphaera insulae]|uniref:trypsin-like serine peptidase n=1 Tax=Aquisphaera insulae TaxID=2712864 RepID=UPI0013EA16C6|nr:trypsin-like peptidase domain-containing protein [Aquisphaera insulae]
MLTPSQIARAVTASRDEFADIILRAQREADIPLKDRLFLAAITQAADDAQAFQDAVTRASQDGWLDALIVELILSDRENGELREDRLSTTNDAALQAIVNTAQGLFHPAVAYRGLMNNSRWTGSVVVDGALTGTGLLIAPHLFLTAWHVVATLFRRDLGGYAPIKDATGRLWIDFDVVALPRSQGLAYHPARQVRPHRNWCPMFRPCHDVELQNTLPADRGELDGKWDFAIIRLAEPIGLERSWAPMDARIPVPRARTRVTIFQYANGAAQRYHDHEIVEAGAADREFVPRLRFLHSVNANHGASGGPCLDQDFNLFGVHQGVWQNGGGNGGAVNRGVPTMAICKTINDDPNKLPPLDPTEAPIWTLGDAYPDERFRNHLVLGCGSFLTDLWAAALPGGARVVSVQGYPGSGKTWRARAAEVVLPVANHLKLPLDAPVDVARSAEEFARHLCSRAGSELPTLPAAEKTDSTRSNWYKDVLVPAIIARLDAARQGRLAWVILRDLNSCRVFGEGTSQVLYLLYQQALTNPWLRFLLDGMEGNLAEDLRLAAKIHSVSAISRSDVLQYLRQRVVQVGLDPGALGLPARARGLHQDYLELWNDPARRPTAAQNLAVRVALAIKDYLDAAESQED